MVWYSLIIFVTYIILIITIIPKSGFDFDLFKIKFRLLPYWFKAVSVILIIVSLVIYLFNTEFEKALAYLQSTINLALFVFLFSKQKSEDEYIEQLRIKSFTYSFVSFVALVGAFCGIDINTTDSGFIIDRFALSLLIGLSLLMALIYFYVTLYKLKKENN